MKGEMYLELFTLFHMSKEIFSERSSNLFILLMASFESSGEGNLKKKSKRIKIREKYFFGFSEIDVFKVGSQRRFNFFNEFTNSSQMSFIRVIILIITLFSLFELFRKHYYSQIYLFSEIS